MRLIAIALCLLITGCQNRVDAWELNEIIAKCKERGGVSQINTFIQNTARCADGAWINPTGPKQ